MISRLMSLCLLEAMLACSTSQSLDDSEPNPKNGDATLKGDVTKATQPYCGFNDPINQLEWLNAKVKTFENFKVGQYNVFVLRYNQSFYFEVGSVASSSPASDIYDCSGKPALQTLGVSYEDFFTKAEVVQTLYSKK